MHQLFIEDTAIYVSLSDFSRLVVLTKIILRSKYLSICYTWIEPFLFFETCCADNNKKYLSIFYTWIEQKQKSYTSARLFCLAAAFFRYSLFSSTLHDHSFGMLRLVCPCMSSSKYSRDTAASRRRDKTISPTHPALTQCEKILWVHLFLSLELAGRRRAHALSMVPYVTWLGAPYLSDDLRKCW